MLLYGLHVYSVQAVLQGSIVLLSFQPRSAQFLNASVFALDSGWGDMMTTQYSPYNIMVVERALAERNKCACHPSTGTVKTYAGWKEIGRQVKKGEKSFVSVATFIPDRRHKSDVEQLDK